MSGHLRNDVIGAGPVAALADAQLPDFGDPSIVPIAAAIGSILLGVQALARGRTRDDAAEAFFYGVLAGGCLGLIGYLALLIEGLL